VITSRS